MGRRPHERLRISGNVLNLPLRPPAVLARAAASLDLLRGGRFELGLGAGAFWDAIEAHGGARLTAAAGGRRPARGHRRHPRRLGRRRRRAAAAGREVLPRRRRQARPGAGTRHRIWLGAYKPRMLALTGQKADGWLPTLEYLRSPDGVTANRLIDEAAIAAGREPREIRRLLNLFTVDVSSRSRGFLQGPVEQWVDQLLPLVVEDGFSTFLIGRDDPRAHPDLRAGVAPALREAVAKERRHRG